MWTLWFIPLIFLCFLIGAVLALIRFFTSRKSMSARIVALVTIPIGCAVLPIIGLGLIATIGTLSQKDDAQLYEEIFGYKPTIAEDRMLFDDFGSGSRREIFMRAEPTAAEKRKLLMIPGVIDSDFTLDEFVARAAPHNFLWWISNNSADDGYCKSARIVDAHGFRGWAELRIAECLDAGTEFPASTNAGKVYVIASRLA